MVFPGTAAGIIPLETFHLPHAARRVWARKSFEVKIDSAFSEVIRACARRDETWINEEIVASYENLHAIGHAHSWRRGKKASWRRIVRGWRFGGGFFGESMFHRVTDASKIALAALVETIETTRLCLALHPMAHAASPSVRSSRDFAARVFSAARRGPLI